ncbi:MAG: transposase [Deltaproteobacteria bacterium]|nr:transposase [Deltaproteobacteria bacterium]
MIGFVVFAMLCSFAVGRLSTRHYRRDIISATGRRQQLRILALEVKNLRYKLSAQPRRATRRTSPAEVKLIRRRPCLNIWIKWILSLIYRIYPWAMSYSSFKPETIINWLHQRSRRKHADKIAEGKKRGRPPTPNYIVEAVLRIARECPDYGAAKISGMIKSDLEFTICKKSVIAILRKNGIKPRKKTRRRNPVQNQGWQTLLANHVVWAMDFKTTFDPRGNMIYILNIVDHTRRKLVWSRATYTPCTQWVTQQLREVVGWDEPPYALIFDRDSSFLPVARKTLPSMGIKPVRIGYKCPWHNGVVERFNRTLQEELLDAVLPINVRHMNWLLSKYQEYYNTTRPHMANGGYPPELPQPTADSGVIYGRRKIESVKWLGGLHKSYRWVA